MIGLGNPPKRERGSGDFPVTSTVLDWVTMIVDSTRVVILLHECIAIRFSPMLHSTRQLFSCYLRMYVLRIIPLISGFRQHPLCS